MYDIDSLPGLIELGHLNEKGVCEIAFDVTDWLTAYDEGVLNITYIRPGETDVYPVDMTGVSIAAPTSGNLALTLADEVYTLTWTVSDAVTAIAGAGSIVAQLTEGGTIKKRSDKVQTIVMDGHAAAGDPPEPLADYVQKWSAVDVEVTESVPGTAPTAEVTQNESGTHFMFDLPTDMTADATATTLDTGEPATAEVTQNGTGAHFVFGLPRGLTGAQGIQGIQGLTGNGIDNIARTSGDGSPGMTDTYTIAYTDAPATTFSVYNGANGDITGVTVDGAEVVPAAGVVDLTESFERYALWRKTSAANPVSVYPVPESPMYTKVSGTFTQAGMGDPSPSNIRQITPWLASGASAKVKRTGKNLLDLNALSGGYLNGSLVYTPSGTWRTTDFISVQEGATYFYTSNSYIRSGQARRGVYYDENKVAVSEIVTIASSSSLENSPLTIPAGIHYVRMHFKIESLTDFPNTQQFELGSTATPYDPYSGQEITLTAPQEIPAGWMDNEGKGERTWGVYVCAGNTPFIKSGGDTYHKLNLPNGKSSTALCNAFKKGGSVEYEDIPVDGFNYYGVADIVMRQPDYPLVADWKIHLQELYDAGTPIIFAYQLTTPVTITPAIASLTALPQLDRITPRQNVLTATPASGIELTYAKSPIRESDEIAAAIALLP